MEMKIDAKRPGMIVPTDLTLSQFRRLAGVSEQANLIEYTFNVKRIGLVTLIAEGNAVNAYVSGNSDLGITDKNYIRSELNRMVREKGVSHG